MSEQIGRNSSAHPLGPNCVDGTMEGHDWAPLSFVFETQLLDEEGRVRVRQPALDDARVYCVCMKCRGYTYVVTEWVGFFLGGPEADSRGEEQ
jgi:hypothetical protein